MCVSKAHVDTSYLSEGDSLEVSNHLQGYSMRMAFLKPLIKPHLSLHLPQGRTPELQPLTLCLCVTLLPLLPSLLHWPPISPLLCLFIHGSCLAVGYLGCPRVATLFSVTSPCGYYSKREQQARGAHAHASNNNNNNLKKDCPGYKNTPV